MYDVIVIGGGIIGSWTALHLVRNGFRTLLVEQHSSGKSQGSSQGQTRNFHITDPGSSPLVIDSLKEVKELEKTSGQQLLNYVGRVTFGKKESEFLKRTEKVLTEEGQPFEILDSKSLQKKFPSLRYDDSYRTIYQSQAGSFFAARTLATVQAEFRSLDGVVLEDCTVTSIRSDGEGVTIQTKKGKLEGSKVVVCAGPWTPTLLPDIAPLLRVEAIAVCYWQEAKEGAYSADRGFPSFSHRPEVELYGVPALEYPGLVKLAYHGGVPVSHPSEGKSVDHSWHIKYLQNYVREHFPLLKPQPAKIESCFYTWTPDKKYIIDRHPKDKNIVIGAGFCGGGFKVSAAVGKALAFLAAEKEEELPFSISEFSVNRFSKANSKI